MRSSATMAASAARWILPLEVLGIVWGCTRRTRAGRSPLRWRTACVTSLGDAGQLLGRQAVAPHLGDHVQPLGAGALALDPDGRRVPDAGDVVDGLLDVGGDDVLAAHDDHVLDAPGDEEVALGVEEPEVAGVEPARRGGRGRCASGSR